MSCITFCKTCYLSRNCYIIVLKMWCWLMKDFKLTKETEDKSVLKTIRIKLSTLNKVEELANKNNLSVNKLLNQCINFALDNLVDDEKNNP